MKQPSPRRDVRALAKKCAALPLCHATPNAEFDPVVESVGQALGPNATTSADDLGAVLGGTLHEQGIGIGGPTSGLSSPIRTDHLRPPQPATWPAHWIHAGRYVLM